MGIFFPEVSKNTLLSVLTRSDGKIRAGGEYWDAIIWVTGAWNYYVYTGDKEFLTLAFDVTQKTIRFFEETELDEKLNSFRGPACYGDGVAAYPDIYAESGESGIISFVKTHPELKANKGVGIPVHCLSTNCLYYNAYVLAGKMAEVLGKEKTFQEKAEALKASINNKFWMDEKGCYRYIIDDFGGCESREGLGQSFAVLFDIADDEQKTKIFENQHITRQGIACLYPSFQRYINYGENHFGRHSGVIWPHISAFWADAATQNGRLDLFEKELFAMTRRVVRDGHFAEIYHPETGEIYGGVQELCGEGITLWRSMIKQTWSATGYIRMLMLNMLGLHYTSQGVEIIPQLPKSF